MKAQKERRRAKEGRRPKSPSVQRIAFGGGCFWCSEAIFQLVDGVTKVTSGYAGGSTKNPTYDKVSTGKTGHAEVVLVEYDSSKASLEEMLKIFIEAHDPTSLNRQGNDIGTQYRSIILYGNDKQKGIILRFMKRAQKDFSRPIVTELKRLEKFYPAEPYHEKYFEKNPNQAYSRYVIAPKVEKIRKLLKR